MLDRSKRRSLKVFGGATVLALGPASVLGSLSHAHTANVGPNLDSQPTDGLVIELLLGEAPKMRVTNYGNELAILRRVHPGEIHVDDKTYNLNYALIGSAYAIGAGRSRLVPITESSDSTDLALPTGMSRTRLRVASMNANNTHGRTLNSSRVFVS